MNTKAILQALNVFMADNTRENAEKLAQAAGFKIAPVSLNANMNAGAGSGAIGRFATLTGDSENGQQAYDDALQLTGLPVDIEVIDSQELPLDVPMRYNLLEHQIEVNSNFPIKLTRAEAAQAMAEELLHSTDHVGNGYTLSAGSRRMSLQRGDLALEAIRHFEQKGYFAEFLYYPLSEKFEYEFTSDRIKAELFARLGVLYLAQPELVKQVLPLAYEVFHGCFGLSTASPVGNDYVRGKIWSKDSRGVNQVRLQLRNVETIQENATGRYRQQSSNHGLENFRYQLAKLLDSPSNGRKARL